MLQRHTVCDSGSSRKYGARFAATGQIAIFLGWQIIENFCQVSILLQPTGEGLDCSDKNI
jgi:hypothetical protein